MKQTLIEKIRSITDIIFDWAVIAIIICVIVMIFLMLENNQLLKQRNEAMQKIIDKEQSINLTD